MPLGHCGRCFGQAGHHHSLHWALWVQSASGCFWAGLQHGPSFLGRDSIWPCIPRKDCGQHVSVRFGKWQGNFQVEWSAVQCIHTQDFTWFCPPWWRFPMALWSWDLQATLLKTQAKFRRHIRPYPTSSKPVGTMRQRFPSPRSLWEAEKKALWI